MTLHLAAPLMLALLSAPPPRAPGPEVLECGATLTVIEDPNQSFATGVIFVEAGFELEAPDQVGLVRILAEALADTGSGDEDRAEVDTWLDAHSGELQIAGDRRSLVLDFRCAPEETARTLTVVRDLLRDPVYPESSIERARNKVIEVLLPYTRTARKIANRGAYEVAYGSAVPGRRIPHEDDVRALTRETALAYHRAHVGADRVHIGLMVPAADGVSELVQELFAELPRVGPAPVSAWPAFDRRSGLRIVLIDVPDSTATELRLGFPGISRGDPDVAALQLWGAYFAAAGRRQGLPGTPEEILASSRFNFVYDRMTYAEVVVPHELADTGLETLVAALSPDEETELEPARLEAARGALLRQIAPDDARGRMRIEVARHMAGGSQAGAAQLSADVAALDGAATMETVRAHTPGAGLLAVVAGPAELLEPLLAPLGPLEVRSGLRQPRGTAAGVAARGRLLATLGGEQRWAEIETLELRGQTSLPNLPEPVPWRLQRDLTSQSLRLEQIISGQVTTIVSTPEASWMLSQGNFTPMDAARHEAQRFAEDRQIFGLWRDLARGRDLHVDTDEEGRLACRRDGRVLAWFVLGEDGRPTLRGYEGQDGETATLQFKAWAEVDGLALPVRLSQPAKGIEYRWEGFRPNVELDPSLFERSGD